MFKALLATLIFILSGCEDAKKTTEDKAELTCGSIKSTVHYRVQGNTDATHFAIVLAGSPVKEYFSEPTSALRGGFLVADLVNKGYRVFEVKYEGEQGFYTACKRQGFDNIANHCSSLYELAVKELGYDRKNSKHEIVGFGWSIGAIQLQAMAFMKGDHFDRLALTGVLLGNVEAGCRSAIDEKDDGYSWRAFLNLAGEVTSNGTGCRGQSEYSSKLNFENQPYYTASSLAIFEGEGLTRSDRIPVAGNIAQARYIVQKRQEANAPVKLISYPNCGHDVIECSKGKAEKDIVDFLTGK